MITGKKQTNFFKGMDWNMKAKKIVALALALAMLFTLAACGKSATTESPAASGGASAAASTGDITIGVDSHVSGGVRVEKATGFFNTDRKRPPRIIIGPNAVVEGPLVFERPVTLHVHKSARTGPVTGATAQGFDGDSAPKD